MKLSAAKARRKWSCRGRACGKRPSVAAAALLLVLAAGALPGHARPLPHGGGILPEPARVRSRVSIPLPKARPAEAPAGEHEENKPAEADKQAADQAASPSACRLALTEAIAIAPSIP